MRTVFETEGDVRSMDVLAGLVALWREGASGSLQFSRSGQTAGFVFSGGEITSTRSSDPRFESASILVRAGKLDEGTLARLAVPEGGDRALLALQSGLLTRREWRWGEKIRAVEVLSDLLGWIEGDYLLLHAPPAEPGDFRLPVPRLILELFLRSRDRSLVLHHLGGADVPLARTESFDTEFATFGLTADAESVVRLIDGRSTAEEIASEAPAEAFAVEKLLAALVTLGLVHAEFSAGSAARARPTEAETAADPAQDLRNEEPEPAGEQETEDESEGQGLAEVLRTEAAATPESEGPEALEEPETDLDSLEPEPFEPESASPAGTFAGESPMAGARLHDGEAEEADIGAHDLGGEGPGRLDAREPESWDGTEAAPEPPLDLATGIGAIDRPQHRSSRALVWVFAALVAGVGAVVWLRSRMPAPPVAAVAAATPTPAETTPTAVRPEGEPPAAAAAPEPSSAALPTPSAAPPTVAPRATRTRPAAPTARPSRVPAVPTPEPRTATAEESPRETTRQFWTERAARDAKRWKADKKSRYTIQLELACEIGSLVDAWKHDRPAGTMWVLTSSFQGRPCFRVLWGRYTTRDAARQALAGIPPFFTTPRNRPVVTAVR